MSEEILHLVPTLDESGAERQLCLLAAGLAARGRRVRVVTLTRGGPLEGVLAAAGVPVEHVGKRGKFDPAASSRLTRLLKARRPAILQTWLFAASAYGRFAAHRAGVPLTIVSERCVDVWKSGWQRWVDRRLAPGTAAWVVNSHAVGAHYVGQGVPAAKIARIANAVEPPPSEEAGLALRRELALPDGAFLVGFVGRLWPQKRVEDLICAIDVLRLAELPAHLAIVGDGPSREKCADLVRRLDLSERVRFLGHRPGARGLMAAFDVVALPSDFEGMPNVLLEAMAAGKPVVATRIPGMDEIVDHGVNGLLSPPRDLLELARSLDQLARDRELAGRMGAAGRARAATEFSTDALVSGHERLYRRLLAGEGPT